MKRPHENDDVPNYQSSRKRLCDVKKDMNAADTRIINIEQAIRTLKREREFAVAARGELDTSHRSVSVPYARAWNRLFASKLLARLPRAIRDMIYANLWTNFSSCSMGMASVLSGNKLALKYSRPHVADPAYVGPRVAREVVESFYTTTDRHWQCLDRCLHTDKPSDLERYLHKDVLKVGINPLEHLRGLAIHFYIDKILAEGDRGRQLSVVDLGDSLTSLLQIARKKDFWLQVKLEQKRIRFILLHELFQKLRPVVEVFEAEGARVAVLFVYRVQRYNNKFEIPVTDLVKMSHTEEWKTRLEASLLKYKNRIHRGDSEYYREMLWDYNSNDHPDDHYYKSSQDERYNVDSDSDV